MRWGSSSVNAGTFLLRGQRYKVHRVIGRGAHSVVWQCTQRGMSSNLSLGIALKLSAAGGSGDGDEREADALKLLAEAADSLGVPHSTAAVFPQVDHVFLPPPMPAAPLTGDFDTWCGAAARTRLYRRATRPGAIVARSFSLFGAAGAWLPSLPSGLCPRSRDTAGRRP